MLRFLPLIFIAVYLPATAAGLGFNPFDKGSPTSAGGAQSTRPAGPATPAPTKVSPGPAPQSKPETPPAKTTQPPKK